jgi:hypothetical protein
MYRRFHNWRRGEMGSIRQSIGMKRTCIAAEQPHGLEGCRGLLLDQTLVSEKGNSLMSSNTFELKTAIFEDGTHAVLRADPAKPRHLEVIATFFEAVHARDYARLHGAPAEEHREEIQPNVRQAAKGKPRQAATAKSRPAEPAAKPDPAVKAKPKIEAKPKRTASVQAKQAAEGKSKDPGNGISDRQAAVLKGLRSLMDKKNRVEAKAVDLAKASSVPLGSLHSILVSLEKKQIIRTERRGSPKHSAIYEVLETSQKSTRSLNGAVHSEAGAAQAAH